jgi:hypothetical protein
MARGDEEFTVDEAIDELAASISKQREALALLAECAEASIEDEDVEKMKVWLRSSVDVAQELFDQSADAKGMLAALAVKTRERGEGLVNADRHSHEDRVTKLLGTSSDSTPTPTGGDGEREGEVAASTLSEPSGASQSVYASEPSAADAVPDAVADAARDAGKFTSSSGANAARKRWSKQKEGLAQAVRPARPETATRNPEVARSEGDLGAIVFDEMIRDEKRLRRYISRRMDQGQDLPPGLLRAVDLFARRAEETVQRPHTFDELAKLTREQRRALMRQLEAEARAQPFSADTWRAQQPSNTQ